ncbi:tRNA (adenosine(37)-N6)-threonylcarbamoyltransferase complex dimerization subunit type 1 TsaB [Streptococcus porci]|uniref:tRNA (adenosine(37)-N6)-threonylcarbamoyltransferase complex dimerization subunit type 1 TsaB n=1 Tax=Streptococcus porci TaxID=502567 RepID=UPI0003F6E512|nr:tRNA (adenosine(37)-N6)-threonylcarbamoyltransferase complex dimerization subunit type 1 TsaB [Streptococcus porci]
MKVLAFDTSSKAMSVALLEDCQLLAEHTLNVKKNHSISLMPVIDFMMKQVGWKPTDLERIVVAQGPGSYTGLRVAVATAKTLAYTLAIDLVGVSSLHALCPERSGLLVPIIDARRNNVYAGFYDNGRATQPDCHINFSDLLAMLKGHEKVVFVGEVEAFRNQIEEVLPQAQIQPTLPSAALIGKLGQKLKPVVAHAFVPEYLKKVEAEENWLKTNLETNADYIKRV